MRSFQTETAETAALTNYESRRNAHGTFWGCHVNGLTQASAFSPAIRTWGCLIDLEQLRNFASEEKTTQYKDESMKELEYLNSDSVNGLQMQYCTICM